MHKNNTLWSVWSVLSASELQCFTYISEILIFRTSKGCGNWLEELGVRKIKGGIKLYLFYHSVVLWEPSSHARQCMWHLYSQIKSSYYNPSQNVWGHLKKLGTKTHFAKLTHILPLKEAWGCCYKGLFLLSLSLPSSVEGRCLNLTSYCVSVPRVLTMVVV